jgi:capsid protein
MFDGDPSGLGYADFVRQQLLGVAAGMDGLPYELLSGDMRGVNDRLMRVILNEYHRRLEQAQWHCTIPQVCERVWGAWIGAAVLAGALPAPLYDEDPGLYATVQWRTAGWPYVHLLQDIQAKALAKKEGFESRAAIVAEQGWDVEEVDQQNREDKDREEELGLEYGDKIPPPATSAPASTGVKA